MTVQNQFQQIFWPPGPEPRPEAKRFAGIYFAQSCGVVWCGMVVCGVVWHVVWYGGMVVWHVVWYGVVWYGVVWCGMVWYGVVWCGMVWFGVVWCGLVWFGVIIQHF